MSSSDLSVQFCLIWHALAEDRGLAAPSGQTILIGEDGGKVFHAARTTGMEP